MTTYRSLINLVKQHNTKYYDLNSPTISDSEYDRLYDHLVEIEKQQGWADHDSPTRLVGGAPGKIKHKFPLYSLKKVYNLDEVDTSFNIKTIKLDGANLTLTYINGNLANALTRGNGLYGENVIHLVKFIKGIPSTIDYMDELVITGECISDNLDVDNYRNYVSGALGLKEASEIKNRNIRYVIHDRLGCQKDYTERLKELEQYSFSTILSEDYAKYPSDGVVYRLDSYEESEELGYTSKYPRFAVALKQAGLLTEQTILQDVIWVVGRTGVVTPVGLIKPVIIDGATISRVTLHNIDIIESHKLGLGDTIEIERSGGVIPKFLKVIEHSPFDQKIGIKHAEASIGSEVKRVGPRLYALEASQSTASKYLIHFVKTMGIKGLGPKTIELLKLEHPSEIYSNLDWNILGARGTKIQQEIQISKHKPYETVLASLGIPGVGPSTATQIVENIPSFHNLREEIEKISIPGIGLKIKQQVLAWLDVNEDWVKNLPLCLSNDNNASIDIETPINVKKVCVTGKMDITKAELATLLKEFNIKVVDDLTKDVKVLIVAGEPTKKVLKARSWGIKIIDYWKNKNSILQGQI